jgi:hypothetical protein
MSQTHQMRDTSLDAYHTLEDLGQRQWQVYHAIQQLWFKQGGPTDREIARYLGYSDPNKVRPRRKELLDAGLIVEGGKRVCSVSGIVAYTWIISRKGKSSP